MDQEQYATPSSLFILKDIIPHDMKDMQDGGTNVIQRSERMGKQPPALKTYPDAEASLELKIEDNYLLEWLFEEAEHTEELENRLSELHRLEAELRCTLQWPLELAEHDRLQTTLGAIQQEMSEKELEMEYGMRWLTDRYTGGGDG